MVGASQVGEGGKEPFASMRGHVDSEEVRVLFDNKFSLLVRGFSKQPGR